MISFPFNSAIFSTITAAQFPFSDFVLRSPTSFGFDAFIVNPSVVPQPGDTVRAEFKIQSSDHPNSFNLVVETFPTIVTQNPGGIALSVNPATSSLNDAKVYTGTTNLFVIDGDIELHTLNDIILENAPTLPTFPGVQSSNLTITFTLFINDKMVTQQSSNALVTVTWYSISGQSVEGFINFTSDEFTNESFAGSFSTNNSPFILADSLITGTITTNGPSSGPNFNIRMDITANMLTRQFMPGVVLTGYLLPLTSQLNNQTITSYVDGGTTQASSLVLNFKVGQVVDFVEIPMVTNNFPALMTLTQTFSNNCSLQI